MIVKLINVLRKIYIDDVNIYNNFTQSNVRTTKHLRYKFHYREIILHFYNVGLLT